MVLLPSSTLGFISVYWSFGHDILKFNPVLDCSEQESYSGSLDKPLNFSDPCETGGLKPTNPNQLPAFESHTGEGKEQGTVGERS